MFRDSSVCRRDGGRCSSPMATASLFNGDRSTGGDSNYSAVGGISGPGLAGTHSQRQFVCRVLRYHDGHPDFHRLAANRRARNDPHVHQRLGRPGRNQSEFFRPREYGHVQRREISGAALPPFRPSSPLQQPPRRAS